MLTLLYILCWFTALWMTSLVIVKIVYKNKLDFHVELIMNGDMASHMSDSETSNVHHGLSVLNSDITRSLLEMHSEQQPNLKWKRL